MVFLCFCVATGAMAVSQVAALERTLIGELIAAAMIVGGEWFRRHGEDTWFGTTWFGTRWLSTTIMSAGYSLAYFFVYSLFYVPALKSMNTPYLTWALTATVGIAGTYHGTINRTLKWFASVFTLIVTGHALYQVFHATGAVSVFGLNMKAAALGCLGGMIWSAAMSSLHKRLEQPFKENGATPSKADWLLHRCLHETYFVIAGLTAMALPLIQSSWHDAAFCWPLEAAVLLAISYRSGNVIKHIGVAAMWLAGAAVMVYSTQWNDTFSWFSFAATLLSGAGMAATYRYFGSDKKKALRRIACQTYLYAGIAAAVAVPGLLHGIYASAQLWMIEGVVIAGLGVALRHRNVHLAGTAVSLGAVALFFSQTLTQWQDWTWALLAPIFIGAYALSAAYSFVVKKGGLKQSEFFVDAQFNEDAVSLDAAKHLETIWSWVGCSTLLVSSLVLINNNTTVVWWSVEALLLIAVGFIAQRIGYRVQGLVAIALSVGKLLFFNQLASLSLSSIQYGVVGTAAMIASFLYFKEERRRTRPAAPAAAVASTPSATLPSNDNDGINN
jgi:hypothetical protein